MKKITTVVATINVLLERHLLRESQGLDKCTALDDVLSMTAEQVSFENDCRPMDTLDVINGQIVFREMDSGIVGQVVIKVFFPDHDAMAYMANDGYMYGLRGAYVLK